MKRLFMQKLKVYLFVYTQFWWNYRGFLKKLQLNFILQIQHLENNFIFLNLNNFALMYSSPLTPTSCGFCVFLAD